MTTKNIQIKDSEGNVLYPKTLSSIVFNNSNESLGTVEAGAQVNKIETIKVNGVELSIVSKAVDITVPSAPVYTIVKAETAESGFLATYNLTKDGTNTGASINIPKDFLVKSGEVKTCTEDDKPVEGYKVGDKYIDFVINSKEGSATDEHMYILVSDLIKVYTVADTSTIDMTLTGTEIKGDVKVSAEANNSLVAKDDGLFIDISGKQNSLSDAQLAAANSGITADKVSGYDTHVANTTVHITADERTAWNAKQAALTTDQLAAVNSGITSTKVATYDGYASGKQDALTTDQLAAVNSGITSTKVATYDGYATSKADKSTSLTFEELA